MLSINDYNHLKLLYDNFFKFNKHIRTLIEEEDWDSADIAIQEKDNLIKQILFFEKPRLNEIKENKELLNLRLQLIEYEKENIVLIASMKEKLASEITTINKAKKILNAYEPTTTNTVSTFEIKEDE